MERQFRQAHLGIQVACPFGTIGTLHGGYLLTFIIENAIDIVRAITLRHIDELGADIAHRTLLIHQVGDAEIGRHGEFLLGLDDVEVTVHDAFNVWHVRDDAQHLVEVEVAQADGDVLQGILIVIIRIDAKSHVARRLQHQVGRHTLVISQHQVVVVIGSELLVAQDRMCIYQRHLDAIVLHHGCQTDIHAQLVVGIIYLGGDIGATLLQLAIHQGTEGVLRILLVVLHSCRILDGIPLGMDERTDGIELDALSYQGIDVEITIQACYRRGVQVHFHRLELITAILDEARDEVALACREIDMSQRELATDTHLVDAAFLHLGCQFGSQAIHRLQQRLVATPHIHVEMEVATVGYRMSRITASIEIHQHIHWSIGLLFRAQGDVTDGSLHIIVVAQVGIHIDMATEGSHHRHLCDLETIEIGMAHICCHRGLDILAIGQRIQAHQSLEIVILAIHICVYLAIGDIGDRQQVAYLVLAIMYRGDSCLRLHSGTRRQEIGADARGFDITGKGIKILLGQEMLGLDIACLYLGLISESIHVEVAIRLLLQVGRCLEIQASLAFGDSQLGGIFIAISLHVATDADATRHTNLTHQRWVEHTSNEAQVIGLRIQVDIRLQSVHVQEVRQFSIRLHRECRRQNSLHTREGKRLQVALHRTFQAQRIIRPTASHLLRQGIAHEQHQV